MRMTKRTSVADAATNVIRKRNWSVKAAIKPTIAAAQSKCCAREDSASAVRTSGGDRLI